MPNLIQSTLDMTHPDLIPDASGSPDGTCFISSEFAWLNSEPNPNTDQHFAELYAAERDYYKRMGVNTTGEMAPMTGSIRTSAGRRRS